MPAATAGVTASTATRHICTVSVPFRGRDIPISVLSDGTVVAMTGGVSYRPEPEARDRIEKAIAAKYQRLAAQAEQVTDPVWLDTINEQLNQLEAGRVALTREA